MGIKHKPTTDTRMTLNRRRRASKRKRRATSALLKPNYKLCTICDIRYDSSRNNKKKCVFHNGEKMVDRDWEFWDGNYEYDEDALEEVGDDPDWGEGFMWDCCGGRGGCRGCVEMVHD